MEGWMTQLYERLIEGIQLLTGFHFFAHFLKKRLYLTDYIIFLVVGLLLFEIFPSEMAGFPLYLLLLLIWGVFLCRNWTAIVLYSVVAAEILQLGFGIINSMLSLLAPALLLGHSALTGIWIMIAGDTTALLLAVLCYNGISRILDTIPDLVGDLFFSKKESQAKDEQFVRQNSHYFSKNMLLLVAPVLLLLLVSAYISTGIYGNTVELTTLEKSIVKQGRDWSMLAIQLLGLASLFCMMYAYRKLAEGVCHYAEIALLEQEAQFQHQYVTEAKLRYEKTKIFRHDIKNHILVTKELLAKQRFEEATQYLGELEQMAEELSFSYHTGHHVLDTLIGYKLGLAKSEGIDVSCSLELPEICTIKDIDFCIILSNALDNAIHACRESGKLGKSVEKEAKRFIHVSGVLQGDFILIQVENSINRRKTGKTGELGNTGETMILEGTGLTSIRMTAERYRGSVKVEVQGGVFCLSILLVQN